MRKKHYEAIASIILFEKRRPLGHDEWHKIPEYISKALADYFEQDNPKFNRARFLEDCGVESHCNTCDCGRVASLKEIGHHDDCSIYKTY